MQKAPVALKVDLNENIDLIDDDPILTAKASTQNPNRMIFGRSPHKYMNANPSRDTLLQNGSLSQLVSAPDPIMKTNNNSK